MTVTLAEITTFLGWCSLINIVLLLWTVMCLTVFRRPILQLHGAMLGLSEEDLARRYLDFMVQYKVLIVVFNLVPWVVLKIMV